MLYPIRTIPHWPLADSRHQLSMSMSSAHVRRTWKYDVEQDLCLTPGGQTTWEAGSPHRFGSVQDGQSSAELVIPLQDFAEDDEVSQCKGSHLTIQNPYAGMLWDVDRNSSLLVTAVTTPQIEEGKHTIMKLYDLSKPNQPSKTLFEASGSISELSFHPTRPQTIVFAYAEDGEPDRHSVLYVWDLKVSTASALSEESLDAAVTDATGAIIRHLPGFDMQESESVIRRHLKSLASRNSIGRLPHYEGRLPSAASSFSHRGDRVLLLPAGWCRSNGRDDGWIITVQSLDEDTRVELVGHTDSIMKAVFSPSDRYILSVCWDKTVKVWTTDGTCKYTWKTTGQNWRGIFDPEERFVVATCGSAPRILCWSLETGESLWTIPDERGDWSRALDVSPDGRWLAIGSAGNGGRLGLVDLSTPPRDGVREFKIIRCLGGGGVQWEFASDAENVPNGSRWDPSRMAKNMAECVQVRFFRRPTAKDWSLAYTCTIDPGLEVFNMGDDTKWRCEPALRQGEDLGGLRGWKVMAGGKIITVSSDAIRIWQL